MSSDRETALTSGDIYAIIFHARTLIITTMTAKIMTTGNQQARREC